MSAAPLQSQALGGNALSRGGAQMNVTRPMVLNAPTNSATPERSNEMGMNMGQPMGGAGPTGYGGTAAPLPMTPGGVPSTGPLTSPVGQPGQSAQPVVGSPEWAQQQQNLRSGQAPGGTAAPAPVGGQPGVPGWAQPPNANGGFQTPGWQYGLQGNQGNIQNSVGQGQGYIDRAGDAYYRQATSRLDPRFAQAGAALDTQLANQGITPGSEAWNNAKREQAFAQNDAYGSAMNNAILTSGAEGSRLQGMDIAAGNFGNAAQQQRFGQLMDQARLNNDAYGTQQGLDTQRYIADRNLAGSQSIAGAQISAAQATAAANAALGNRRMDLDERQFDFNAGRTMRFDPIVEQNLLMQGMQPGDLNFPGTQVPGYPNYQSPYNAQQQYQNNQNAGNQSLYSLGGNLIQRFANGG